MKHPDGLQVLLAIDQLANTLLGGMADETMSSRAYRLARRGHWYQQIPMRFINLLFFFQPEHCKQAYESEVAGNHFPASIKEDLGKKELGTS